MSGNKSSNQNTNATFDRNTTEKVTGLPETQGQFFGALNKYNTTFNKTAPRSAGLKFEQPFSNTLDPIVEGMKSAGFQDINNRTGALNRSLSDVLSIKGTGDNTALLASLQGGNNRASIGASNALIPEIAKTQRDFDVARSGILQGQNELRLNQANAMNQANSNRLNSTAQFAGILADLQKAGAGKTSLESGSGITNVDSKDRKGVLAK